MAGHTAEMVRNTIVLVLGTAAIGAGVFWSVKKAEDPARMIFKWVLTVPILVYMLWVVAPIVGQGGYGGAFGGIPLAAVCGLGLAIIWRRSLASLIATPISSLYDGGSEPPVPKPAYSVAQSKQKQGKFLEAVVEIRGQLARFPDDLEGQLMLAQIQAEDLKDLASAELTIERLCAQPGHAPCNIAYALSSLADWHLKFAQDREAARQDLESIIKLLPDSEFALVAAQRIAHLGSHEMLLAPHERKRFTVAEGAQNLGLVSGDEQPKAMEISPEQAAAAHVKDLEEHPLDTEAREKLAVIYADHYGRLDLAADQLEQMIEQPNQPARLAVRWLNLLADLQVRNGASYEEVRPTLERIVERDPNAAAAEIARNRLALLKLELKGREQRRSVKLGSYEQNIGLKAKRGNNKPARESSQGN